MSGINKSSNSIALRACSVRKPLSRLDVFLRGLCLLINLFLFLCCGSVFVQLSFLLVRFLSHYRSIFVPLSFLLVPFSFHCRSIIVPGGSIFVPLSFHYRSCWFLFRSMIVPLSFHYRSFWFHLVGIHLVGHLRVPKTQILLLFT